MKLHTPTFTPLGEFYTQTHSLLVSGSITLHSPFLLTLQNLHIGSHILSTSFTLKMLSKMCAETLEKLQHNATPTQDLKLHIRQRLWKPTGMMKVIKYFKHITVYCIQTIKILKSHIINCTDISHINIFDGLLFMFNYNRLVTVNYESLSSRKPFKTSFTVSFVCT